VEAGTSQVVVELEPEAGSPGIELYRCDDKGDCHKQRKVDWNGRSKRLVVESPQPGQWKAMISSHDVEQVRATWRLVQSHPKYGMWVGGDARTQRKAGESWRVPYTVWRREPVPQGQQLAAIVQVDTFGMRVSGSDTKLHAAPALLRVMPLGN
jgi:hypothetical protein